MSVCGGVTRARDGRAGAVLRADRFSVTAPQVAHTKPNVVFSTSLPLPPSPPPSLPWVQAVATEMPKWPEHSSYIVTVPTDATGSPPDGLTPVGDLSAPPVSKKANLL